MASVDNEVAFDADHTGLREDAGGTGGAAVPYAPLG